jgi:hypothetical protein
MGMVNRNHYTMLFSVYARRAASLIEGFERRGG